MTNRHLPALLLVVFLLPLCACAAAANNYVCYRDHRFEVEVARTARKKSRGLMFRESLEPNKGMLFVYKQEKRYVFWMKNVAIPLDIVWINAEKEVVHISKDAQPCPKEPCPRIVPDRAAKYVLELNAGAAERIGLKKGDRVRFEIPGLSGQR